MKFMNDWIGLALALTLVCGGLVAGRRLGVVAAWWLAGGAWLGLRFSDRMWKPAVIEMRESYPGLELATCIPLTYALLFAALFIPTVIWIAITRPKSDFALPAGSEVGLGYTGGLVAGVMLFLALVQSHVMHPDARENMPRTIGWGASVLSGLGQQHVAPSGTPQPVPAEGGK